MEGLVDGEMVCVDGMSKVLAGERRLGGGRCATDGMSLQMCCDTFGDILFGDAEESPELLIDGFDVVVSQGGEALMRVETIDEVLECFLHGALKGVLYAHAACFFIEDVGFFHGASVMDQPIDFAFS